METLQEYEQANELRSNIPGHLGLFKGKPAALLHLG
jgi:hypothetical protein